MAMYYYACKIRKSSSKNKMLEEQSLVDHRVQRYNTQEEFKGIKSDNKLTTRVHNYKPSSSSLGELPQCSSVLLTRINHKHIAHKVDDDDEDDSRLQTRIKKIDLDDNDSKVYCDEHNSDESHVDESHDYYNTSSISFLDSNCYCDQFIHFNHCDSIPNDTIINDHCEVHKSNRKYNTSKEIDYTREEDYDKINYKSKTPVSTIRKEFRNSVNDASTSTSDFVKNSKKNDDESGRSETRKLKTIQKGTSLSCETSTSSSPHFDPQPVKDVLFKDSKLVAGAMEGLLNFLIEKLTSSTESLNSLSFTLILSSRLLIEPIQVFQKIFNPFLSQDNNHSQSEIGRNVEKCEQSIHHRSSYTFISTNSINESIENKYIQLLDEWVSQFSTDFQQDNMMQLFQKILTQFNSSAYERSQQVRDQISQMNGRLLSRLTELEKYEACLSKFIKEASIGEPISTPSVLTICPTPAKLAEQLTHIEIERLSFIGPEELIFFVSKTKCTCQAYFRTGNTNCIESYEEWYRHLSNFVSSELCKISKKKTRSRVLQYWIEVAKECYMIGNFNSLMAIIGALSAGPVIRLKKTWSKVCNSDFVFLKKKMDPRDDYYSYRMVFSRVVSGLATFSSDQKPIVPVPYFPLFLKDLSTIHKSSDSFLQNGFINFEKFHRLSHRIKDVLKLQNPPTTSQLQKDSAIIYALQKSPVYTTKELILASYQCEAPIGITEKEQYRKLVHQLSGFPNMFTCNSYNTSSSENEIMTVTTIEPI